MIEEISFEKYRGFQQFRMERLSPVNLIVGRNNCGKTSALEAVQLMVSGGDPGVLAQIAWQRGEVVLSHDDNDRTRRDASPDISHFFHGHNFGPGVYFCIATKNGVGKLTVHISLPEEKEIQKRLFEEFGDVSPAYAVVFEGASHRLAKEGNALPVTEDGAFLVDRLYRFARRPGSTPDATPTVQFITPDSLEPRSMSDMWDRVLVEGKEEIVIKAMRILEDDLTDIFFLSGQRAVRSGGRGGVLLGFKGTKRRIPMGSHGEGMRRLLALSLSLSQAAGGVLLVDEIDTGLHWSTMADMWQMVVSSAVDTNTQVFATTHSLDCLRGLASLCEDHKGLAEHVSVHKIDRELEEAVVFDVSQIEIAVSQEIEVR